MINTRKRRITNGEKTLPGEHPWIVALAYRKTVGCGGTIMVSYPQGARYVIHCEKDFYGDKEILQTIS